MQKYKAINKNHSRKKWLLVAAAVVVLAGVGAAGWYVFLRPDNQAAQTDAPDKDTTATLKTKEDLADDDDKKVDDTKTSNQIPVAPPATSSATFTNLSQSGNTISVAARVTGMQPGGTCVVTFSKDDNKPVVHEFDAQQKADELACSTGDISALEFSALGEWQATLRYYLGSQQVVTQQNINIK